MKDQPAHGPIFPDAVSEVAPIPVAYADTPLDRRMRHQMLRQQVIARGVKSTRVVRAMAGVPRHYFVDAALHAQAYADSALEVSAGQTISQPYMVALMTERLDIHRDHQVLEIGTGTGYQTAILARLAHEVFTVERLASLSVAAQRRLRQLGLTNIHYRIGDGSMGWPGELRFQRILVTAGAPDYPVALLRQLVIGGKLVIPIGDESQQTLMVLEHTSNGFSRREVIACRFVPLVGQQGWPAPNRPQ